MQSYLKEMISWFTKECMHWKEYSSAMKVQKKKNQLSTHGPQISDRYARLEKMIAGNKTSRISI